MSLSLWNSTSILESKAENSNQKKFLRLKKKKDLLVTRENEHWSR